MNKRSTYTTKLTFLFCLFQHFHRFGVTVFFFFFFDCTLRALSVWSKKKKRPRSFLETTLQYFFFFFFSPSTFLLVLSFLLFLFFFFCRIYRQNRSQVLYVTHPGENERKKKRKVWRDPKTKTNKQKKRPNCRGTVEYRPEKRNSVLICRQYFLPFFFIVFIADHQNLSLQTPSKRTSQPFASVRRKKKEVEENRKEKKKKQRFLSVFFSFVLRL